MKKILSFLFLLSLVSCTTTEVTETYPVLNTKIITTNTPLSLTSTPGKIEITPTATTPSPTTSPSVISPVTLAPEALCDPSTVDFCITDGHFILQRPIQPPANDLIDPGYGYGSTANGTRDPHHGVEFSNPSGTPVHAAGEGIVIFAGPDQDAMYAPWGNFYGNLVVVEHADELFTLYAHLSKVDVSVNQKVFAGDTVGEVGRTGGAIGSHLHFEVRRGNVDDYFATQNPELWLIPAKDVNGVPFGKLMITVADEEGRLVEHANFTIGYYSDSAQPPIKIYYAAPYSSDMLTGKENVVLSELSPGQYRIAVEMNGQLLERWVEVESGRLTQVVFVVK